IALDLADGQLFLVDVGQDAACRFAVEADAGNDPVVPAVLLRPAGGFEIHVVVPRRGIRMRSENGHLRMYGSKDVRISGCSEGNGSRLRQHQHPHFLRFLHRQIHERGTLCPASTQMYSQAKLPANARPAASATAAGIPVHSAPTMADMAAVPIAPPQNSFANGPRRMA